MDYDAILQGIERGVPLCAHLGLRGISVGPGHAMVQLPDADYLRNHIGTQHGSGIFAAAEASSGAAVFGAFAQQMNRYTPLAERGEIAFKRVGRGPLDAASSMARSPRELLESVERDGRVRFSVAVEVRDQSREVVAIATFHWLLRQNETPEDWTAKATGSRRAA